MEVTALAVQLTVSAIFSRDPACFQPAAGSHGISRVLS